jgi:xylan 1,4-beta-xylosidase
MNGGIKMENLKLQSQRAASALCVALLFVLCFVTDTDAQRRRGRASAQRNAAVYTNPVMAGDYPDPSVIRVGNDYWATATSSEWAPEFPLLHSRDLVNWRVVGAVFQTRPAWSVGNYWAPEIAEDRGRFFIYYTARRRDGPLCVAVATARNPAGPYRDHGPLICQDAGSIDGFPIRDERGQFYLVWKEDGNSRNLPTPIWAQRLSEDGTRLVGERTELIRNDAPWEAQLVEGPYIMRRGEYFYMFYSGNACCGRECNYATGVARARNLLGPWEKNPANPILRGNNDWRCPGHGTIVSAGTGRGQRDYLMYHAYHPTDTVYVGRQALLDEVRWGRDGWPTINEGRGPSARADSPLRIPERDEEYNFSDEFTTARIRPGWQWPHANPPRIEMQPARGGRLVLRASGTNNQNDVLGAVVGWWTMRGDYTATTVVDTRGGSGFAGLGAYGDAENALGLAIGSNGRVVLYRRERGQHAVVSETNLTGDMQRGNLLHIRMTAHGGNRFRFAISRDGQRWQTIGDELDGSYLPPWDRGIRVALTASGISRFESLRIAPTSRS